MLRLDVSDTVENIQRVVDCAISIWGRIDVVVNNAGLGMKSVLEEGGYVGTYAGDSSATGPF